MKRGGGGRGGAIFRNRQPRNANPYPATRNAANSRVSDVSIASSRPSSIGAGGRHDYLLPTEKSRQADAVSSINAFLTSRGSLLCLKTHPVSSGKDITESLLFVLNQLDYHVTKLEDELLFILKSMNCPFKVNKTSLRAPNTPHNWPSFLAVIHWLVQLAIYKDHLAQSSRQFVQTKTSVFYPLESYLHFLRGDDDAADACDNEYREKLEKERDGRVDNVAALEREAEALTKNLEELKNEPTEKETLEKEKERLETDIKKVEEAISKMVIMINAKEREMEEALKVLNVKVEEKRRIDEENLDLKSKVDGQSFNARDADRMKRELLAMEREIGEAEKSRNSWEEKSWDVDTKIGSKLEELEEMAIECNQAMKRLKHGNNLKYVIDPKGSTPAEITGIDYKQIIKPEIEHFETEMKKNSIEKLDESVAIKKESSDLSATIEAKRNRICFLQSQIEEINNQISNLEKESEDYRHVCETEAKRLMEEVHLDAQNMKGLESEAVEILKATTVKQQETARLYDEQIQIEARQLFSVVDAVSKYNGHVKSHLLTMKKKIAETAQAVSDIYQNPLPVQLGSSLAVDN